MATIAIIDDNTEQSGTILANLQIVIEEFNSEFEVITSLPFRDPNEYFDFIERNDICVFIIDEKLNDQTIDINGPIDYKGSHLVTFLRSKLKDFPIYSVTNFIDAEELKEKESEFEDVIRRNDFIQNTNKYFPRIIRAAQKYVKENLDELSDFHQITAEISGGNKDPDLIKKLQALQIKLELPFSGFNERNVWLNEYEKQINSLEKLNEVIKSKLNNNDELETNRPQ